jgi:phosphodiesterase/alkaline phosphatase D-like protein
MRSFFTVAVALWAAWAGGAHAGFPNGIASGDVHQRSVYLWARSDTPGLVRFEVSNEVGFSAILRSAERIIRDTVVPAKVTVRARY